MPSIDSGLIVPEGRTWLGTPYRHQHQRRHVAVDCVGLIIGVGEGLGVLHITAADFSRYAAYGRTPNPARMGEAMAQFLVPMAVSRETLPRDGSICWMGWRDHLPMHLGIVSTLPDGRRGLIHAYERVGWCVEHGFSAEWRDRVQSWWEYPNLKG